MGELSPEQYVSFFLAGEVFAYQVKLIREIISYRVPTPVPGAEGNVEGVLNVRGEIIPVLSGEKYLHVNSSDVYQRILILDSSHGTVGIAVEQVGEIFLVDQRDITKESDTSKKVVGTVLHGHNLVILLQAL